MLKVDVNIKMEECMASTWSRVLVTYSQRDDIVSRPRSDDMHAQHR